MSDRSRQRAQCFAQITCAADQPFDLGMRILPDRICLGQQRAAGWHQGETPAAAVLLIDRNLQKPAPFERLEIGRKSRAVHGEQGRNAAERRRFGPVERHQQRELTVGQVERTQHVVEPPRQRAGSAVHMQAQAVVAYQVSGSERKLIIFCTEV